MTDAGRCAGGGEVFQQARIAGAQAQGRLVGGDGLRGATREQQDVAEIGMGFDEVGLELERTGQRRHRFGETATLGESDRFATERPRELQACRRQRRIEPQRRLELNDGLGSTTESGERDGEVDVDICGGAEAE